MSALTISQLAHAGGVGVETVRFYQRKGLLEDPRPASRVSVAGRRHYGPDDLRLALDSTGERPRARAMARERIAALDQQIAILQEARQSLSKLARECARSDEGPCPIIESFELA
jgi:MerR family mercuric resistance operon transcriptional regulator